MEKKDQLNPEADNLDNSKGYENTELENNNAEEKQKGNQDITADSNEKDSGDEAVKTDKKDTDSEEKAEIVSNNNVSDSYTQDKSSENDSGGNTDQKPGSDDTKEVEDKEPYEEKGDQQKTVTSDAGTSGTESGNKKPGNEDGEKARESAKQKIDQEKHDAVSGEFSQDDDSTDKYKELSKEELVEAIESLVKNDDIEYIRKHIGHIKAAFRVVLKNESLDEYEKSLDSDHDSEKEKQDDPLVVRFDNAFDLYKKKKAVYDRDLEKQKRDNLAAKEQILDNLRELIESDEELKHTYDMFRDLQEKWKHIGPVPQSSKSTLWNNYHFLVEKFFDKVKINKELKDLDLKKNLEAKTKLCEKAEELLLENSITKSFQKLQKLHEAWKETGPVPNDKKDEIWDRFKAATNKLNKRRSEFYQNLREQQEKNYSAKLVLCEKAEALLEDKPDTPKKWQENSEKINELFRVWKTIGFAPRKVNNEVWNRFKTSLDTFFKNKKEFFKAYKEQQNENYNQKLNLCMQAEAIKNSDDWKNATDQLIALQKEWKKIGPVPAKFSNKIWKRFRAACDEFFNRKAEYFSNINQRQEDNLKKKQELIEKIKSYNYSDDNNENLEILKNFQREWMEIGHVPIKEKDRIQSEYRKTIDEQFEKLKISKKVKNTIAFKNKMENVKETPNAENLINKERNFLVNKINNLKNDISVWENNIGFFASSEKAEVLKNEFQQKIDNAKQEIEVIEEKLKILKDV